MTKKTTTRKPPPIGPIIRLIRVQAKARGLTASSLSKQAGIPYSRAWELLSGNGNRKLVNVEKALSLLAPDVLLEIKATAEALERGR